MAKTPVSLCFISQQVYFISCGPYHWSLKTVYYNNNNNNIALLKQGMPEE
jgi:hypothetical protein